MASLERLASLIQELKSTCSARRKVQLLQSYSDLQSILKCIYSDQAFGITSKAIADQQLSPLDCRIKDVNHLVSLLSAGQLKFSRQSASILSSFVNTNPNHSDLIKSIIDKNLKARIGPGLLKQAFGADQSRLPIALGIQYDTIESCKQAIHKSLSSGHHWLYSRKVDGVRCLAKLNVHRQVELLSRQSKPFKCPLRSFKCHFDYLLRLPFEHNGEAIFLDGELAVVDAWQDNFTESFTDTVKLLSSDNDTDSQGLYYFVFDCLTESELLKSATNNNVKLSDRLKRLEALSPTNSQSRVVLLPQWSISSAEYIDQIVRDQIHPLQWEGAMLRRDCEYQGKRTADLVKVKMFKEAECRVIDIELAAMRFLDNGMDREEVVCKSLLVEHITTSGEKAMVNVGSGMNAVERRLFAEHPGQVIDKLVTVKYFEETMNEQGRKSLRFPVFKNIVSEENK